jgi:hypothetical protein
MQNALLGAVTSNLRAVLVRYDSSSVHFEAYYDGEIGDDERELMSLVETEVLAALPSSNTVEHTLTRLDAPALIPKERSWVYFRKEPLLD